MLKFFRVICLLISSVFALEAIARPVTVKAKLTDQYGRSVKNLKIQCKTPQGMIDIPFTYDKLTNISFTAGMGDSLFISGFEYKRVHRTTTENILKKKHVELPKPFYFTDLVNPQFYIHYGGLWLLLFIVFAETGLFFGFFLPGDSLLFISGVVSQNLAKSFIDTGSDFGNLLLVIVLIFIAGFLGDWVGYTSGARGRYIFYRMKDTWYFKRRYLDDAKIFYRKHGHIAIVLARFFPILRTFAPIVAGIVRMEKKKFMFYNALGCACWVILLVGGGHYLDAYIRETFHFELKDHLEMIIVGLIIITTAPVLYKMIRPTRPGSRKIIKK
ncbi:DedA family protein [Haoranjiania flava]|uniref:DedA family protein n=1 Tax=Haoranjiania flava TaxID=1856322 RepID=A0AAE3IQ56_9BACT|nr:DedA family protein [Haoranjiania flava]MCU7695033.1 DedA family protein [Haoranjiania flava]